jgi:hypothetical protein
MTQRFCLSISIVKFIVRLVRLISSRAAEMSLSRFYQQDVTIIMANTMVICGIQDELLDQVIEME